MEEKRVKAFHKALGAVIRRRRQGASYSQERFGEALGVSFQMIQKYENGSCRIPLERLIIASTILNCSVQALIDEASKPAPLPVPKRLHCFLNGEEIGDFLDKVEYIGPTSAEMYFRGDTGFKAFIEAFRSGETVEIKLVSSDRPDKAVVFGAYIMGIDRSVETRTGGVRDNQMCISLYRTPLTP